MKSPVFKALLVKRNKVEKTLKDKVRNRKSKAAKKREKEDLDSF